MKYDKQLNEKIDANSDEKYAKFHSSLVPNTKIKGVKIPVLRKIAKEFSVYDDFLKNITLDSYESISVACYYTGATTKNTEQLKTRLEFILPYINNWAVCDTFVSSLKILKTKKDEMYSTILNYLKSDSEFVVRFAIVCLLTYFINNDNIEFLLDKMVDLQNKTYYIDMAIAWFVSVAFVKCREKTLKFLQNERFKKNVQNKIISKICDSFRVSKFDKEIVKKLKY